MEEPCKGFPAFGLVPWRIRRWLLLLVGAYVASTFAVHWFTVHQEINPVARPWVGFVPSLFFIALAAGMVWVVCSFADEMLVRLDLQAAAFAFLATLFGGTLLDGLAQAGVYEAPRDVLESAAILAWVGAILVLAWRQR